MLVLLPETSFVEYGAVPPFYLGPCTAALDAATGAVASSCSAHAVVPTLYGNGSVELTDVSAAITVQPVSNCMGSADDGSAFCSSCPLDMLHLPGRCPPGTYVYRCARVLRVGPFIQHMCDSFMRFIQHMSDSPSPGG